MAVKKKAVPRKSIETNLLGTRVINTQGLPKEKWAQAKDPTATHESWRRVGDEAFVRAVWIDKTGDCMLLVEFYDGSLVELYAKRCQTCRREGDELIATGETVVGLGGITRKRLQNLCETLLRYGCSDEDIRAHGDEEVSVILDVHGMRGEDQPYVRVMDKTGDELLGEEKLSSVKFEG